MDASMVESMVYVTPHCCTTAAADWAIVILSGY
jgi:hypothetical protein